MWFSQASTLPGTRGNSVAEAWNELQKFRFWTGASGRRYVHTVYSLRECPEIANAVYLLVRTSPNGESEVVRVSQTESSSESLNLAQIRYHAARLGANEVHIHMIAETPACRQLADIDLRASIFHSLSAEAAQPEVRCVA